MGWTRGEWGRFPLISFYWLPLPCCIIFDNGSTFCLHLQDQIYTARLPRIVFFKSKLRSKLSYLIHDFDVHSTLLKKIAMGYMDSYIYIYTHIYVITNWEYIIELSSNDNLCMLKFAEYHIAFSTSLVLCNYYEILWWNVAKSPQLKWFRI